MDDIDPEIFSKNLKLRIQYFLGRPIIYYVGKKTKIVRVTARSIWAGMPHIHVILNFRFDHTYFYPPCHRETIEINVIVAIYYRTATIVAYTIYIRYMLRASV